jgi:hypothetical protein
MASSMFGFGLSQSLAGQFGGPTDCSLPNYVPVRSYGFNPLVGFSGFGISSNGSMGNLLFRSGAGIQKKPMCGMVPIRLLFGRA